MKSNKTKSNKAWKETVSAATVQINKSGAQGVLVPGPFILTAAHCIDWTASGDMALAEDDYLTSITTRSGVTTRLKVVAVEPVRDIAVLASPDYQKLTDDADRFEEWCDVTSPIPLYELPVTPRSYIRVSVLTHTHSWVRGTATCFDLAPLAGRTWVEFERPILGGTSGGPVIVQDGRLLGVVSQVNDVEEGPCNGMMPVAWSALPRWVKRRIELDVAQAEEQVS